MENSDRDSKTAVVKPQRTPSETTVVTMNEMNGYSSKAKLAEEDKVDDPWDIAELKDTGTPWSELTGGGKVMRVFLIFIKIVGLLGLLYMFIVSLDFLSSAFRLLGGKAAGQVFAENEILSNPVAGLMIGVLATVLVQSSSTSTSIVVSMVGSEILTVQVAIPIVMGANIGTSVTNTIVAMGSIGDAAEFRRAFAGATVHDMFNWLTVLILLPIEAITHMLYWITWEITQGAGEASEDFDNPDMLKVITSPFAKLIIQIDKKVITKIAEGADADQFRIMKTSCTSKTEFEDYQALNISCVKASNATTLSPLTTTQQVINNVTYYTNATCTWNYYTDQKAVKSRCEYWFRGLADDWSDAAIGTLLLVIALLILCVCLVCIVKLLHSLLKGRIAVAIQKFINADFPKVPWLTGYLAILLGAGMTIVVQSSSIFTSAITPLVGVGVITLDRMYPLTLGANIGTTFTAVLASFTQSGKSFQLALQVALCHLFFNILGILIYYPIPIMRQGPIKLAKLMGNTTAKYRWFAITYTILMFLLVPAAVFGLSLAGWYVLIAVGGPLLILILFIAIVNNINSKWPGKLPRRLQSWDWLPLGLRSLEPYDRVFRKMCVCCKCKFCDNCRKDDSIEGGHELNGKVNPAFKPDNDVNTRM